MNCFEWRKKISGSVSVDVSLSVTGESYSETGAQTFTHDALYSGWTHRELQCEGAPLGDVPDWVLRGDNLCEGRAYLLGKLTQQNTMTVTVVSGESTWQYDAGLYFQVQENGIWKTTTSLLPMSPYPTWENDPYSVALRSALDGLAGNYLYAGIFDTAYGPPPDSVGFPTAPVALNWLKNGVSGSNQDAGLTVTLNVNFALP